jgi:hypothetical protein
VDEEMILLGKLTYAWRVIEKSLRNAAPRQMFDKIQSVCYKNDTFPLFLRGQGARRFLTASAF